LSGTENLKMAARAGTKGQRDWTYERVLETFPRLKERLHHGGQQLSGGEQKAAHLAMAFASLDEPYGALLLLDEPTASLDLTRQVLVAAVLRRFAQAGGTVIVATHDLAFARTCDAVLVLAEGRAIGLGAPSAELTPTVIAATWGASAQAEA
jgi:branched-chain amino acid transport system ATP-binding protein